jgi:alpha-beta hydrolase superfamily lysophospholipase
MHLIDWKWNTKDGLEMYSKAWVPSDEAKGVACCLHGVGDHIGRYQPLAEALTAESYVLAGFDQRGFGKSEGRRGHVLSLDEYFDDIETFLAEIGQRFPDKPLFIIGLSMGAILALAYTPVRQPAVIGVVSFCPGLETALKEQPLKVMLSKLLGTILPTITLESGVDPDTLSRDPQVAVDFINDPLVHFKITTGWGKTMLDAIDVVYENAPRFPKPLLLLHGTNDELAYPRSSQKVAELAPRDKVTLKMCNGFMHDLITDPESAEVFSTVVNWLHEQRAKETAVI